MDPLETDTALLVKRAQAGDREALNEIFTRNRGRLKRMVEMRMDRRLRARIDASDVLQAGYLDAVGKLDHYLSDPKIPVFLWLRLVVGERLSKLHRMHVGTLMRDGDREIPIHRGPVPPASSAMLAAQLLGHETSPTGAAVRAERALRLQEALNSLDPDDREILSLRHFEELSRSEVAQALEITESAAARRYTRALARLRKILQGLPGGLEGL